MKKIAVTEEMCSTLRPPRKRKTIADTVAKGLICRYGARTCSFFTWTQGEIDAATGKRRRVFTPLGTWSETGGMPYRLTLTEARQKVHELRKRQDGAVGEGVKVSAVAESFRDRMLRKTKTKDETWALLERHLLDRSPLPGTPPLKDWDVNKVGLRHLVLLVQQSTKRRVESHRQTGGLVTGHRVTTLAKALFRHAKAVGLAATNPAIDLDHKELGVEPPVARRRFLSEPELKVWFRWLDLEPMLNGTAPPNETKLILGLLTYTPLRRGQIFRALWRNVHLEDSEWTIPEADRKLKPRQLREKPPGPWTCTLAPTAVSILELLRKLDPKAVRVTSLTEDAPNRLLARQLKPDADGVKGLQLDHLVVHDLRRSWRSTASRLGIPFDVAEHSLDHVLPGEGETYDRDPKLGQRHEAVERVGEYLDGIRLGRSAKVLPVRARR
jgi:integrase